MLDVAAIAFLEMRRNECVVDFVKRPRKLLTVAASPLRAADETADLAPRERNLFSDWATIVRMLFQKCDENFVRKLTRLPELWIGTNDDGLLART